MLVNVDIVRFLRRILNPNGAQRMLNDAGYYFDLLPYIENLMKESYPDQNATGLVAYIKNNLPYFLTGDEREVAESINNYLVYDPKAFSLFGFPIMIYSDPAHLRQYALFGGLVLVGIYLWKKR